MESHRKPYIREVKRSWFMDRRAYVKYMVREGTAVFSLIVSIELLAICLIAALYPDAAPQMVASLIQHPAIIALNITALLAVLFHAVTWFNLMPKAVRMFRTRSEQETRLIPARFFVVMLWLVMIVASVIVAFALIFAE